MVDFFLNNKKVKAKDNETIWSVAKKEGIVLPHLCFADKPGYRADGNCRACMVSIEGERVLAASCIRKPTEGMRVLTNDERSTKSRQMVLELLVTDQPDRKTSHDPDSHFWNIASSIDVEKADLTKEIKKVFLVKTPHMSPCRSTLMHVFTVTYVLELVEKFKLMMLLEWVIEVIIQKLFLILMIPWVILHA